MYTHLWPKYLQFSDSAWTEVWGTCGNLSSSGSYFQCCFLPSVSQLNRPNRLLLPLSASPFSSWNHMSDCVNWSSRVGRPWLLTLHWFPGWRTQPHLFLLYQALSQADSLIISFFYHYPPLFTFWWFALELAMMKENWASDQICAASDLHTALKHIFRLSEPEHLFFHLHMYSDLYSSFRWLQVWPESRFLWSGPLTATAHQSRSGWWGQLVLYISSSIPLLHQLDVLFPYLKCSCHHFIPLLTEPIP